MAMTYPVPLEAVIRNISYSEDGNVSAHYLLTGINTSMSIPEKVTAAQVAHDALYKELSKFGLDFSLYGFKARTSPQELIQKMSEGVPDLDPDRYPDFYREVSTFAKQLTSGLRREFQRIYWLEVHMPRDEGTMATVLEALSETDEITEDDMEDVGSLEDRIFKSLPSAFQPYRINTDFFKWVYDRARYRGIDVPVLPPRGAKPTKTFNTEGFPSIHIRKNADGTALLNGFAELYSNGNAKIAKKSFLSNFRAAQFGTAMSVANLTSRSEDLPSGLTSYQSFVTITGAPRRLELNVARFTSVVDRITRVDADFVQHVSFNPEARSKDHYRKLRRKINSENESLSQDDIDAEEYQTKAGEVELYRQDVMAGGTAAPMRVVTQFCFAHQNLETLEKETQSIINLFEDNDFELERVPGAQYDGYLSFMPGTLVSDVCDSLKLDTTSYRLSASMPIRSSRVGDPKGVPIAVNKENELGQIVFLDILNATDKGNASIAVTGAQGSGKTHFMKLVMGFLSDVRKTIHILDPSPHGEYEVYARTLDDVSVVNVLGGNVSIDPLKIYDPERARSEFLEVMLPLLEINPRSRAATLLSNMLETGYRDTYGISSTRDLLNQMKIVSGENKDLVPAYNALNFFAQQDYSRALIDPLDSAGRVIDLPALNTDKRVVVFRTAGLVVNKSPNLEDITPRQRMSQALFLSIALYTAHRFQEINDVCVLVGDEMHTLKGNERVMDMLIKTPDRMGRKDKNWILAGSQLAEDMDENFALIRKRLVLKQEKNDNARAALDWIDLDGSDPRLVDRLIADTSPLDPVTDGVTPGREGEGWFNDGRNNIARVKVFNHLLPDRATASDTTSSRMQRAED